VEIAPRVSGSIVNLPLRDNQAVKVRDLLFEIDPTDYELALERARSSLASLDKQIAIAATQDESLKYAVKAAEAAAASAESKAKQAESTLNRLKPLLEKGFTTAETVEQAQTASSVGNSALAAEMQRLNQARVAVSASEALIAERAGAVAQLKTAETNLSYCRVTAPFDGRVVSLNISEGAFASAGHPVFALLDTRHWYIMADFREGVLPRIAPGDAAEIYLLSAPGIRFRGRVQSVGWAVHSEDNRVLMGVPYVKKEINWVHVAQRFPVRIEVENPDPELFRMGASAVVTIRGPAKAEH
jgi:multidrug efflux system membrane fusion protein